MNDTSQLGRGGGGGGLERGSFFLLFYLLLVQCVLNFSSLFFFSLFCLFFECYFTSLVQAMRQSCRDGFSQSGLAGLALSFDRLCISLSQAYRSVV